MFHLPFCSELALLASKRPPMMWSSCQCVITTASSMTNSKIGLTGQMYLEQNKVRMKTTGARTLKITSSSWVHDVSGTQKTTRNLEAPKFSLINSSMKRSSSWGIPASPSEVSKQRLNDNYHVSSMDHDVNAFGLASVLAGRRCTTSAITRTIWPLRTIRCIHVQLCTHTGNIHGESAENGRDLTSKSLELTPCFQLWRTSLRALRHSLYEDGSR